MEETYKIPENIKSLIDIEFLNLFNKNICEVFGYDSLDDYVANVQGGTGGWYTALKNTCFELKKLEILGYWEKLEWYDSDYFDGELADMMLENGIISKAPVDENGIVKYE